MSVLEERRSYAHAVPFFDAAFACICLSRRGTAVPVPAKQAVRLWANFQPRPEKNGNCHSTKVCRLAQKLGNRERRDRRCQNRIHQNVGF